MGLVVLRNESQCFIEPIVHPIFDMSYMSNYSQKEMGVIVDNCRQTCSQSMPSLVIGVSCKCKSLIIITCEVCL